MSTLAAWFNDSDGDGIPDDILARIVLALPQDDESRAFWSDLLDLASQLGLGTAALPLPLVLPNGNEHVPTGCQQIRIETHDQLRDFASESHGSTYPEDAERLSNCLTHLFTTEGALTDRNGDQLADGTRIRFNLPDRLPATLGAALGNLAARIGLESGGIDLPLAGSGAAMFDVQPGSEPATLRATDTGWLATGDADGLALLINNVAAQWPHITVPETDGAAYSLAWLRRALAGDGPETRPAGSMLWELQWSAQWEVERIWDAFNAQVLRNIDPARPVRLTIMASEPEPIRRTLCARLDAALRIQGVADATVQSVCTFKSGLSWLKEIVLPALHGKQIGSLRITYKRFPVDDDSLDLPIRWLQELFPGDELLARELDIPLDSIEIVESDGEGPIFTASATTPEGSSIGSWWFTPLYRIQPFVAVIPGSGTVCVTTSGIIIEQGTERRDVPVQSDLETFWTFWQSEVIPRLLTHIDNQGGPQVSLQPFFERLECDVSISEPNSRLGIREENDSAAEALHEDIYFNTLDAIEMYGERQTGERTSAPGAVVPIVRVLNGGTPYASVRLYQAPQPLNLPYPALAVRELELQDGEFLLHIQVDGTNAATAARLIKLAGMPAPDGASLPALVTCMETTVELWLPLQEVITGVIGAGEPPTMLHNIHGEAVLAEATRVAGFDNVSAWVDDHSYQGRPIVALSLATNPEGRLGSPAKRSILKPTCLIVARHHANEISSTNAAFRLAYLCASDPEWQAIIKMVNVVVIPYENPDGAALHAQLSSDPAARNWKHHPARYNALGTEFSGSFFDHDTRFGESHVRPALWRRFLPDAIVDNHGVPSHEWVQPFAGFGSPPRFRVSYWIPQALLYGIVGFVDSDEFPEHRRMADALRDDVSAAIRETDIGALNEEIGRSYRVWGQQREPERFPGQFHNGMLWHINGSAPDPQGRGFASRYPATTVLNWVTEVNDETAAGEHLERTARAHLLANRALLDLLCAAAVLPERVDDPESGTYRWQRKRPLDVG